MSHCWAPTNIFILHVRHPYVITSSHVIWVEMYCTSVPATGASTIIYTIYMLYIKHVKLGVVPKATVLVHLASINGGPTAVLGGEWHCLLNVSPHIRFMLREGMIIIITYCRWM